MEKCKSYNSGIKYRGFDGIPYEQGYCSATKECESCSCGGDELKCDFYEYIRERARARQIESIKVMPLTATEIESPSIEVIGLNVDTLVKALLKRSFKEKQTFPWWVFQEIYKWNDNKFKGE